MSRSDEEIVDELDLRLGYSIGWAGPKPLPVLPVKQIPIIGESEYVNKFASVSREIQAILDAERVDGSPRLVFRYSYEDKVPVEEDVTILRKADDSLKKLTLYLRNYLPAIERPFLMITEGDVLRATTLYVVHPINLALNAKYKDSPIYCLSENTVDVAI
jgi:hypothetical protein